MLSDDPVDLTVDPRDLLPQAVADEWLPNEDESILFLFQKFNKYPPHPSHYILPPNLQSALHQDPIHMPSYESLLTIAPPALPSISKAYQNAIKESNHHILSATFYPHPGDPIRLPIWILTYWAEIGRVVDTQKWWKIALAWVREHSTSPLAQGFCSDLLLGLSSFSWSRGAAYTCDITPLLSDSSTELYLSSFHIDCMIRQTRTQYKAQHGPNQADRHIFANVDLFTAVICFYGTVHVKKEGYLWNSLMVIENKIIMGQVDSFGGIMHLPLHWVSVVINFQ